MTSASSEDSKGAEASGVSPRSAARLAAVQALYEMDLAGASADQVLGEFLKERWKGIPADNEDAIGATPVPMTAPDGALLAELVRGVTASLSDLDGMIGLSLSGDWTISRLEVLLRAILRSGAFELSRMSDVPARVVIDEYVNIAKAFYDDSQPGLINGVLDKLAHVLRPGEFDGGDGN